MEIHKAKIPKIYVYFCFQNEIALLTTQLRNIERKILRGIRDRNTRSLGTTGLPALLESTYRAMFMHLEELERAQAVNRPLRNSVEMHPVSCFFHVLYVSTLMSLPPVK